MPFIQPFIQVSEVPLKVAYLVNQYPKVSHSFIRREILGVEACGVEVERYAIRACQTELVDAADVAELDKTRVVLDQGLAKCLLQSVWTLLRRPVQWLQALGLAVKLGYRSERGLLLHLVYLAEACVLRDWFERSGVQHVHAHFGTNSTTVALLCQALGGPTYSFTVHGPEEFDKVAAIGLTEKINRAAFVVAISSFGRSQLYRWCDLQQWSKIHMVHCGVDDSFLEQPHVPIADTPTLVCVGRLCEQKGQQLLVQAIAHLVAEGLPVKLHLVGDGPMRAEIEALIADKQIQEHITITGWASNDTVRQYLLEARAMVLPSFAEGLPVVIMETLALARPVVTTYVAGIPELVEPGVCGWLVPPGSVEALTVALRSALQTSVDDLNAMGQEGAQRVAQQHCVAIEAQKLARLFRDLER